MERMIAPLWYLAKTNRPILVGPWTSEMGFECLYWIPFLEQLKHRYRIDKDRLYVITRGGAGVWYGAGHSIELFDYVPPADIRVSAIAASKEQASIKQYGITAWERKLLALIAERQGLRRYHVLHPSMVYRTLDHWWGDQTQGFAPMMEHLRFSTMPTPTIPVGMSLPEQYIAMRWYQRPTWPLTDGLLEWVQAMTLSVAEKVPVVLLQSSAYLDDHVDFPAPEHPNIKVIQVEPWRDNLAIQSAIIKKAGAFVGTWGGMAQLAVRLGVPTAAFYDRWHSCSYSHKVLTEWLGMQMGISVFVGRPHDAEFGRAILPKELPLPELPRGSSS